jgi:hypothetical protein
MHRWIPDELREAAATIASIDACELPRRRERLASPLTLALSRAIPLFDGLGGGTRALIVRQLLRALGFDERRYLPWRLEHKLVQALVMHAYLPGLVPVTCGWSAFPAGCPDGCIVKSALGDSSGEQPRGTMAPPTVVRAGLINEEYVVQERIPIAREYRVHSIEDCVMEDLTFRRYEGGSIPDERNAPNAFVQAAIDRLPDGIIGGSLLAWDIALMPDGGFMIIEVNFSGFHPVFKRGFHCSGYFHDYNWGACDTARLLNYVARTDGVAVTVVADAPEYRAENQFYAEASIWQQRHEEAARALTA